MVQQIGPIPSNQKRVNIELQLCLKHHVKAMFPAIEKTLEDQLLVLFMVKWQLALDRVTIALQGSDPFKQRLAQFILDGMRGFSYENFKNSLNIYMPWVVIHKCLNISYQSSLPHPSSTFMKLVEREVYLQDIFENLFK